MHVMETAAIHASPSHSHTMSLLSDLQQFREVLAPGTQARSCYHYITGREPVESQLSCLPVNLVVVVVGGYLLRCVVISCGHRQSDCGWIEMREKVENGCVSMDSNAPDNIFFI